MILLINSSAYAYELYWYIGSAFIKPSKKVASIFQKQNRNIKITIISGGSQILLQKIILSKKGDIYLPAAKHYEKIARKKGIVIYSRDFIEQIPVFGISKKASNKIDNIYDLCGKNIKIALGNEKTMALGRIYSKIEEKMPENLSKCILKNCVIKATNVAQIANYIKMNIVDAGILFSSVANVFKFKIINIPQKFNVIDKAPLILLKFSTNKKIAEKFLNFIINNRKIFENYGYKTCL